jgi:N12 class adenine-specific DNA methylase
MPDLLDQAIGQYRDNASPAESSGGDVLDQVIDFHRAQPAAPQPAIESPQAVVNDAIQPMQAPPPEFDAYAQPQQGAASPFPVDLHPADTYNRDVQQYLTNPLAMQGQRQRVPNQVQGTYDQLVGPRYGIPPLGAAAGNALVSLTQPTAGMAEGESPLYRAAAAATQATGDSGFLEHAAMTQALSQPRDNPFGLPDEVAATVKKGDRYMYFTADELPPDFLHAAQANKQAVLDPDNRALKVPDPWIFQLPDGRFILDRAAGSNRIAAWWGNQRRLRGAEDDVTPAEQSQQLDERRVQNQKSPYPGGLTPALSYEAEERVAKLKGEYLDLPRGKNTASEDTLNLPGAMWGGVKQTAAGISNILGHYHSPNVLPGGGGNFEGKTGFGELGEKMDLSALDTLRKNPIDRKAVRMFSNAPQIAGAVAASALGPEALMIYGGAIAGGDQYEQVFHDVKQQALKQGMSEEDAANLAHRKAFGPAATSIITGAILSRLRLPIDDPDAGFIGNAVRHALAGAAIGSVQDAVDQVSRKIGYGRPIDVEEIFNAGLDNAILSAATHLGMHAMKAGRSPQAGTQSARASDNEPETPFDEAGYQRFKDTIRDNLNDQQRRTWDSMGENERRQSYQNGQRTYEDAKATADEWMGGDQSSRTRSAPPPPGQQPYEGAPGFDPTGEENHQAYGKGFYEDTHPPTMDAAEVAARKSLRIPLNETLNADSVRQYQREAVKRAHPDAGGTATDFQRVRQAFNELWGRYKDVPGPARPREGAQPEQPAQPRRPAPQEQPEESGFARAQSQEGASQANTRARDSEVDPRGTREPAAQGEGDTAESVAQARIKTAKDEILDDVRRGIVPDSIKSFADLHDYVDANAYINDADRPDAMIGRLGKSLGWKQGDYINFSNQLVDSLDAWIKGGMKDDNKPSSNLPDYLREEIDRRYAQAEKMGIVEQVEQMSADRKTAGEIATALNLAGDSIDRKSLVQAVRTKLGIPSMDDRAEFENWLSRRNAANTSPDVLRPTQESPSRPVQEPVSSGRSLSIEPFNSTGLIVRTERNVQSILHTVPGVIYNRSAKGYVFREKQRDAVQEALNTINGQAGAGIAAVHGEASGGPLSHTVAPKHLIDAYDDGNPMPLIQWLDDNDPQWNALHQQLKDVQENPDLQTAPGKRGEKIIHSSTERLETKINNHLDRVIREGERYAASTRQQPQNGQPEYPGTQGQRETPSHGGGDRAAQPSAGSGQNQNPRSAGTHERAVPESGIIQTETSHEPARRNAEDGGQARQPADDTMGRTRQGAVDEVPPEHGEGVVQRGVSRPGGDTGAGGGGDTVRGSGGGGNTPRRGEGDRAERLDQPGGQRGTQHAGTADQNQGERDVSGTAGEGEHQAEEEHSPALGQNHTIEDAGRLHQGGAKQRFRDNVSAITLARQILGEGRPATPDEQANLAKFSGWGSMPGAFNPDSDRAGDWKNEAQQIKGLLSPEEFAAGSKSTLNAHYTSGPIVDGLWNAVKRLGFNRGRVLEPSMGIGNFLGLMPPEMREPSQITGIELDSLTGMLAKLLYPRANIQVKGFQDFHAPDGFFDLAISNFPFGDYRVHDRDYAKHGAFIHDYFFLKSLDKVRPGGLVIAITSTGTMDKLNPRVRKAIAERGDLIAAMRLPGEMFGKTAGTAVVTDILFLRRRAAGEEPASEKWMDVVKVPDPGGGEDIPVNEYFASHPRQILGTLDRSGTMYRGDSKNVTRPADFEKQFADAIGRLPADLYQAATRKPASPKSINPDDLKMGGYTVQGGKVYRNTKQGVVEEEATPARARLISDHLQVRDALRELYTSQLTNAPKSETDAGRARLNEVYDDFVERNGPLHRQANARAFRDDPDAPTILAIEDWNPKTRTARKADVFRQNTVRGYEKPTSADSSSAALGISLNETGAVDLDRMSSLLGRSARDIGQELVKEGLAYENPAGGWESADKYLSGEVRRKLLEAKDAAKADKKFAPNVKALEAVQPPDMEASEINVKLGVPWVAPGDVADFAAHLFSAAPEHFSARYLPTTATWFFDYSRVGANRHQHGVQDSELYGTSRASFPEIMKNALNGTFITIRDKGPDGNSYVNSEATAAANAKVEELQSQFKDWIWQDDARRRRLARTYNDTYNSVVPAKYDGAHLTFPGMSPFWSQRLRAHQRNAVWRTISNGTALYAHEVGTGKTATMVASAMELRRLGLARKPAIVALKSNIEGIVKDAREIYPGAKILHIDKFDAANRKKTIARIASGDWDMVIMTHDNLNLLPMKKEVEQGFIQRELDELENVLRAVQEEEGGSRRGKSDNKLVKQLEKAKVRLEERLKEALDAKRDDAVTFEETGIDALFVDEAHKYKSLPVYSKHQRIKGIPQSSSRSDRATMMAMRTQWLQELQNGRGVVFATGTPIANTMAEMYTMQRYLQPLELQRRGIFAFDAWASTYGTLNTRLEYDVVGQMKPVTRFSEFVNMRSLKQVSSQIMDVQRANKMPGFKRPTRKDEAHAVPMSQEQRDYLSQLRHRAEEARRKRPGEPGDNMLSISMDGRKSALDMRMVDPGAGDDPASKLNKAVSNVLAMHKAHPGKTQMIFLDLGVNPTEWGFSAYNNIIAKLAEGGIPREKIIDFAHLTDAKKRGAVGRLDSGDALVGIGGSEKMGTGVNAQKLLIALHHLDAPWKPSDLEQRDGRGWRSGNQNKEVQIHRYVTKGSFDTFMWQTVTAKHRFINAFMDSDEFANTLKEEGDEGEMSYSQVMAIASGRPALIEKVNVDRDVQNLEGAQRRHTQSQFKLRDTVEELQRSITQKQKQLESLQKDLATSKAAGDEFAFTLGGKTYTDKTEAREAVDNFRAKLFSLPREGKAVGSIHGLALWASADENGERVRLVGQADHHVNSWALGSIEHAAEPSTIEFRIGKARESIQKNQQDMTKAKEQIGAEFGKTGELARKRRRQAYLTDKVSDKAIPVASGQTAADSMKEAIADGKTLDDWRHEHPSTAGNVGQGGEDVQNLWDYVQSGKKAPASPGAPETDYAALQRVPLYEEPGYLRPEDGEGDGEATKAKRGGRGFGGRHGGGVYTGWVEAPVKLVAISGKGTGHFLKGLVDWYSKPLIEAVGDQAKATGKSIANQARHANDYAREIVGKLNIQLVKTLHYVSGRNKDGRRAVRQLRDVRMITTPDVEYGYSAFQSAVEGTNPPGLGKLTLSSAADRAVRNHRDLMIATGKIAVAERWKVADGGTVRDFVPATDGKRLIRSFTPDYWDIAAKGDSDVMKQAVAKAFGHANGIAWQDVMRDISQSAEPATTKENPAETVRKLKYAPTHVRHPDTGVLVQIIHSEPFDSAVHLVRNFSQRAGYVRHFGQDLPGQNHTQQLIDAFKQNGGNEKDIKDLIRALNGVPLHTSQMVTPGTPLYEVTRGLRSLYSLTKAGALTMAFVPNLFETLSKTLAMGGALDYVKAWAMIARHPILAARATADIGARTVDIHNWLGRQGHPIEALVKNIIGLINAPLRLANELNEFQSAAVGMEFSQDLPNSGPGSRKAATLRLLGYSEDEINDLTGPAPSLRLLLTVPGRMAEQTQETTSRASELPRSIHNRFFQNIFPFQHWPAMTVNRVVKMVARIFRPGITAKQRAQHTRILWSMLFGSLAGGAMAAFLMAYLKGGKDEVAVKWSEAKDSPGHFFGHDATGYALFGGLVATLNQTLTDNRDARLLGPAIDASMPASIIEDLNHMSKGTGPYKGLTWLEKAGEFFSRRFAITPSMGTAMAAVGFSDRNVKLDIALRAYYRWRRANPKEKGQGGPDVSGPTGDAFKFVRAMRQFQEASKEGQDDKAMDALADALDVKLEMLNSKKAGEAVAAAIRARQILSRLDDAEYAALKKHIGDGAFDQLEDWDAVLEGWARAVHPKGATRSR